MDFGILYIITVVLIWDIIRTGLRVEEYYEYQKTMRKFITEINKDVVKKDFNNEKHNQLNIFYPSCSGFLYTNEQNSTNNKKEEK